MKDDPKIDLAQELSVEAVGGDRFRRRFESDRAGAFGGDLLGCAVMAATHTCEDKRLHSIHARFLRPVPTDKAVDLVVDRMSDGRRLAHRRVEIAEGGRLLFTLTASFSADQEGKAYQETPFPDDIPAPEDLPCEEECAKAVGWDDWEPWLIEWRWQGAPDAANESSLWSGWARLRKPEGVSAGVQAAGLALIGDIHSDWSTARRFGDASDRDRYTSLDHAMWIHRPFVWDDWLLIQSRSEVAFANRAFTRREVFTRSGELLATICQEALVL